MSATIRPGVICLLVHKESGRTAAHAADFDQSAPAGFTLTEAQERRARRDLISDYLGRACAAPVVRALDGLGADRILAEITHVRDGEFSIVRVAMGHTQSDRNDFDAYVMEPAASRDA